MPSINQQGRETEKVVLPEDAVVVPPEQAQEYGYWGVTPDTTPREEYSFAAHSNRLQERQQSSSDSSGDSGSPARSTARHASSAGSGKQKGSEE